MTEHFDVIIVGSGAGGGTLAHTLAASGKRILILERGDYLPRESENWDPDSGLHRWPVPVSGHLVRRRRQALPASGPLLRRRRHEALRSGALPPAPAGLRRTPSRRRACRPRGRSATTTSSRGTRRPSGCTRCTATTVKTRPKVVGPRPYPSPAVSHEPRIQQLFDDLRSGGYHPFHAPCGILLDETNRPKSSCIRCTWCDGYPCLVHAKADAEVIAVRPIIDQPNVTLLVNAQVVRLDTDATGRSVTGVVVSPERIAGDLHGRHRRGVGRCCQHRQAAPRFGQ